MAGTHASGRVVAFGYPGQQNATRSIPSGDQPHSRCFQSQLKRDPAGRVAWSYLQHQRSGFSLSDTTLFLFYSSGLTRVICVGQIFTQTYEGSNTYHQAKLKARLYARTHTPAHNTFQSVPTIHLDNTRIQYSKLSQRQFKSQHFQKRHRKLSTGGGCVTILQQGCGIPYCHPASSRLYGSCQLSQCSGISRPVSLLIKQTAERWDRFGAEKHTFRQCC